MFKKVKNNPIFVRIFANFLKIVFFYFLKIIFLLFEFENLVSDDRRYREEAETADDDGNLEPML